MKKIVLFLLSSSYLAAQELPAYNIPSLLDLCAEYIIKNIDKYPEKSFRQVPLTILPHLTKKLSSFIITVEKEINIPGDPPQAVMQNAFKHLVRVANKKKIVWPTVLFQHFETYNNILCMTDEKNFDTYFPYTEKIPSADKINLGTSIDSAIVCFAIHPVFPNQFAIGRESGHITLFIIDSESYKIEEHTHAFTFSPIVQLCYDSTGNYLLSYHQNQALYIWYYKNKRACAKINNFNAPCFKNYFYNPHHAAQLNVSRYTHKLPISFIPLRFLSDRLTDEEHLLLLHVMHMEKKLLMNTTVSQKEKTLIKTSINNSSFEQSVKKYLYAIVNQSAIENTAYDNYQLLVHLKEQFTEFKDLVINRLWDFSNFF